MGQKRSGSCRGIDAEKRKCSDTVCVSSTGPAGREGECRRGAGGEEAGAGAGASHFLLAIAGEGRGRNQRACKGRASLQGADVGFPSNGRLQEAVAVLSEGRSDPGATQKQMHAFPESQASSVRR